MLSATESVAPVGAETQLLNAYRTTRRATERLCEPLEIEDYGLQSMPDASPVKWHLAHTSWFFETFLLQPYVAGYRSFQRDFAYLFNSYYEAAGPRWPRPQRGLLARPTVREVFRYRAHVDEHMEKMLESPAATDCGDFAERIRIGINHEQQHQELIVTDLKHAWSCNVIRPQYPCALPSDPPGGAGPLRWLELPARLCDIGHDGVGFAYDNEGPRHRVFVQGFKLANRLVTNREYLAFMNDGGYEHPRAWLSDGWTTRQAQGWTAPLYWQPDGDGWSTMTLGGARALHPDEPVCHLSYFEADAFARWAGARLPTEQEWETAAAGCPIAGHFLEAGFFHPVAALAADDCAPFAKLYGDVWQWTASPYVGYPGYRPADGALGEYNGKFMCNQFVLRGASCATPRSHARCTYRNFFPPAARWQFTGIRLARDL